MSAPSFSLKDHLFNSEKVTALAKEIQAVAPDFDVEAFVFTVVSGFSQRELKQRIAWIREQLHVFLPEDYKQAVGILLKALPAPCDPELSDDDFGDFIYAPYSDFVAYYGCEKRVLDFSLAALEEITQRFSAEFALRPFLSNYPLETLKKLNKWCDHPHYHVRRLVSEGSRPILPWGKKVGLNWEQCEPLLSQLHTDSTRFVQRSVANQLNDWSKTEPERVVNLLGHWRNQGQATDKAIKFIIKHSLRTLLKEGYPQALELMGYPLNPKIQIADLNYSKTVRLGDYFNFSFTLHSHISQRLLIDYVLYYRNKKGLQAAKVYKLKQVELKAGESINLSKRLKLTQRSTRKIYLGDHAFALQINGQLQMKSTFLLD